MSDFGCCEHSPLGTESSLCVLRFLFFFAEPGVVVYWFQPLLRPFFGYRNDNFAANMLSSVHAFAANISLSKLPKRRHGNLTGFVVLLHLNCTAHFFWQKAQEVPTPMPDSRREGSRARKNSPSKLGCAQQWWFQNPNDILAESDVQESILVPLLPVHFHRIKC